MIIIISIIFVLALVFLFLGIKELSREKKNPDNFVVSTGYFSQYGWIETGNGRIKNSYMRGKPYGK